MGFFSSVPSEQMSLTYKLSHLLLVGLFGLCLVFLASLFCVLGSKQLSLLPEVTIITDLSTGLLV